MDDAAEVLLYASGDYSHGRRLFAEPRYRKSAVLRITRQLKKIGFDDVNNAVSDYVRTCMRTPAHKQAEDKQKGGRCACAPIAWVLVAGLSGGRASELENAWNTPYIHARCLFDAHRDIMGEDDSLESREEEERFDKMLEGAK
jgi:hypothetical protein